MRGKLNLVIVLGTTIHLSFVFAADTVLGSPQPGNEVLSLEALLANPEQYDSHQISVPGVLLWHPDEPVLFADMRALQHMDFSRSIRLEMHEKTDFGYLDRLPVIVSGEFGFDPNFHGIGYKGIFIVDKIVPNPGDQFGR